MSEQEFPSEMPYEGSPLENKDLKRKLKEAMELLENYPGHNPWAEDGNLKLLRCDEDDLLRKGKNLCPWHQRYEALKADVAE